MHPFKVIAAPLVKNFLYSFILLLLVVVFIALAILDLQKETLFFSVMVLTIHIYLTESLMRALDLFIRNVKNPNSTPQSSFSDATFTSAADGPSGTHDLGYCCFKPTLRRYKEANQRNSVCY